MPGKQRPEDPEESAFLASEIGVFVRNDIPIFASFKLHQQTPDHYNSLLQKLHVSHGALSHAFKLALGSILSHITHQMFHSCRQTKFNFDQDNEDVEYVLMDMFSCSLRQQRHRLKSKYFDGKASKDIQRTTPMEHTMTDQHWIDLLDHWFDPKITVWFVKTNTISHSKFLFAHLYH